MYKKRAGVEGTHSQAVRRSDVRPYNAVVRLGLWVTVIAAALWVGGKAIKFIEVYLPFAIGAGIVLMVAGLVIQFRKPKAVVGIEKEKVLRQ